MHMASAQVIDAVKIQLTADADLALDRDEESPAPVCPVQDRLLPSPCRSLPEVRPADTARRASDGNLHRGALAQRADGRSSIHRRT